MDSKWLCLADAPETDDKKRPILIRFAREAASITWSARTRTASPTGWSAHFAEGNWTVSKDEPAKRK